MQTDPRIVAELRSMFLTGAMPSRLIRHIADRHEGDPDWPSYVGSYFAEAFSVATVVMDGHPPDVDLDTVDCSDLDRDLLRDMVGRAASWRDSVNGSNQTPWFDGLTVSPDDLTMADQLRPESHPALADCWASMTPGAKDFVRRCMVNAQGYHERVQVLARLAERLQQQVVELERQNEMAKP